MAACDTCGSTILFGGKKNGDSRYCSEKCMASGRVLESASRIPETLVRQKAAAIFEGTCPRCGGEGPVDVHYSHSIWSALITTSWKSTPHIACRTCATKKQALDALGSLLLGWWGIPYGILMTPVQVGRNVAGMFSRRSKGEGPSPELFQQVRLGLAMAAARQGSDRR